MNREELLKRYKKRFQEQLTIGCGRPVCFNPLCCSNQNVAPATPGEADATAEELAEFIAESNGEDEEGLCTPCPQWLNFQKTMSLMDDAQVSGNRSGLVSMINLVFSSPHSLNLSFLKDSPNAIATASEPGINVADLLNLIEIVKEIPFLKSAIGYAIEGYLFEIKRTKVKVEQWNDLHHFLIAFLCLSLKDDVSARNAATMVEKMNELEEKWKEGLAEWLLKFDPFFYKQFIRLFHEHINFLTHNNSWKDPVAWDQLYFVDFFYKRLSPTFGCFGNTLTIYDFQNKVFSDTFSHMLSTRTLRYDLDLNLFTRYNFIPNTECKSVLLRSISAMNQMRARGEGRFLGEIPYFVLVVNRERLIQSATYRLSQVVENNNTILFKKELKIKFDGEEGIDEGGVKKEFFQLIFEQLLDPQFGMFHNFPETRKYWINHTSNDLDEFKLIGILLGLAIYNGVTLNLAFPVGLYRKLMGTHLNFVDLEEVNPKLYSGFNQMLSYQGDDFTDIYDLNFTVSYDVFGSPVSFDLVDEGSSKIVTKENRHDYVERYADWYLNRSVKNQFDSFVRGFRLVCDNTFFSLFFPEELELLICGETELDFEALESSAMYESGYNRSSPVIRNLWSVVHSMTLEQKKKFLSFVTGCDRSPIGGLGKIKLVITRHGADDDRLPQAHTCFNHLLLPPYGTKEKLTERLMMAIENAQGFGMI